MLYGSFPSSFKSKNFTFILDKCIFAYQLATGNHVII